MHAEEELETLSAELSLRTCLVTCTEGGLHAWVQEEVVWLPVLPSGPGSTRAKRPPQACKKRLSWVELRSPSKLGSVANLGCKLRGCSCINMAVWLKQNKIYQQSIFGWNPNTYDQNTTYCFSILICNYINLYTQINPEIGMEYLWHIWPWQFNLGIECVK